MTKYACGSELVFGCISIFQQSLIFRKNLQLLRKAGGDKLLSDNSDETDKRRVIWHMISFSKSQADEQVSPSHFLSVQSRHLTQTLEVFDSASNPPSQCGNQDQFGDLYSSVRGQHVRCHGNSDELIGGCCSGPGNYLRSPVN